VNFPWFARGFDRIEEAPIIHISFVTDGIYLEKFSDAVGPSDFLSSLRVFFEIAKFDFVKVSVLLLLSLLSLQPKDFQVCLIYFNLARTMPTAVDGSQFLFEWDLQNIDISQTDISSPEFSFKGSKFYIGLLKNEGDVSYGCFLESVETSSKPGLIHIRFDLVKRLDSTTSGSFQGQLELKELHRGWGKSNWADPATIQDHILKVKMWTSEYNLEFDLENIDITISSISFPSFLIGETKLRVLFKKNKGRTMYGCYLEDVDSAISNKLRFQVDLFKRLDNCLVKSDKRDFTLNNTDVSHGFEEWFDVETIRDHVFKVKVLIFKTFSDFVEKPIGFEPHGSLLFKKTSSNLSFMVAEEVVFIIQDILTSQRLLSSYA
jgi:hypothetical protein